MNSLAREVVEARFFSLSHVFYPSFFRMRFRTVQPFRPNSILTPFSAENDSRERSRYHREREREREIGLQGRAFQLVDSLTVQRKGWSLSIKELSYTFHDEYVF